MVENLVSTYKCPFCGSQDISEKDIDIVWAAGNTVNIDMHCPSCKKHFMAKTEVVQMELGNIPAHKVEKLQKSLMALKGKLWGDIEIQADLPKDSNAINDEEIMKIREDMNKKDFNLEDLFWNTDQND